MMQTVETITTGTKPERSRALEVVKLQRMTSEGHANHHPQSPIDQSFIGLDADGRAVATYRWIGCDDHFAAA